MHDQSPTFGYLRRKLGEWKEAGVLTPPLPFSADQFRAKAPSAILPVIESLSAAFREAGLNSEVVSSLEDDPSIGLHVGGYDLSLWVSPAANPACLRAMAKLGCQADGIEWFIPYENLHSSLERELQRAVVRLLGPRRQR